MSIEKAKEFLLALKEKGADKAWTEKAAKAKTEEEKLAVVVDMARKMGCDLTAEDIKEALSGLNKGENDLVQIEDEAMECVAGAGSHRRLKGLRSYLHVISAETRDLYIPACPDRAFGF